MIRLCFFIRQLNEGGAQRQLLELVKTLDKKKYDITVLTFYPGGIFWDDFQKVASIRCRSIGKSGRWDTVVFLSKLFKEVRKLRPHIIHSYIVISNILALFLRRASGGARIIWGVRSLDVQTSGETGIAKYLYLLEYKLARFADCIIVNSDTAMSLFPKHGFPIGKMVSIPNGISTENFAPNPESGAKIRKDWEIEPGALVIGIVGRLHPVKDHTLFLKAVSIFSKTHPTARFVCVGSGESGYTQRLMAQSGKLGLEKMVVWAGSRKDIERVYNAFDIFTLCSHSESFPNAICEAMSCGIPVVSTDVGDAARIIGDQGIVVPSGDAAKLADGWERISHMDLKRLGKAARERILENFSIESLVAKTDEVLWPFPDPENTTKRQ